LQYVSAYAAHFKRGATCLSPTRSSNFLIVTRISLFLDSAINHGLDENRFVSQAKLPDRCLTLLLPKRSLLGYKQRCKHKSFRGKRYATTQILSEECFAIVSIKKILFPIARRSTKTLEHSIPMETWVYLKRGGHSASAWITRC